MSKIKILAIAPYMGLKDLIEDEAKYLNEIEVDTYVADMLDGVEIANSIQHKNYSIIISRAGTADLIRKTSHLPVIDIKLSILDMMRSIKLAQMYKGKFAVVGYPSITKTTEIISELLNFDVKVETIRDISEIKEKLIKLKSNEYSMIVGDVITVYHAKKLGLNTILVTTGRESVVSAFEEVIEWHKAFMTKNDTYSLYKNVLDQSGISTIAYDSEGVIILSSIDESLQDYSKILVELEYLIRILKEEGNIKHIKKIGASYLDIKGHVLNTNGKYFYVFYLQTHNDFLKPYNDAISYINSSDIPFSSFDIFNTSSKSLQEVLDSVQEYAPLQDPVIIYGKRGSGKDRLAYVTYQNGTYKKNPLIIIDCKYMNKTKWTSIFESNISPFLNNNTTIYIKNLHLVDIDSQILIESYMTDTVVYKRNKFIFSCIKDYDRSFNDSSLLYYINNILKTLPLILPTLNERSEDIPNLASLYINELNIQYSKQVIGLENEAISILSDFNWVHNIDQFQRVLKEIIILTKGSYITLPTVKHVLSSELTSDVSYGGHALDLNKSLDEISTDIIKIVLNEENQNQSKVATRLGVSRSTVWRKLNEK